MILFVLEFFMTFFWLHDVVTVTVIGVANL